MHMKILGYGVVALGVIALAAAFFYFDLDRFLCAASLKSAREGLSVCYVAHGRVLFLGYALTYVGVSALFLPGTSVLNFIAPGVFGFWPGVVVICLSRALGAIMACHIARSALGSWRDRLEARLGHRMEPVRRSIEDEGPLYLFMLRMVPGLPFQFANLAVGLTRLRLSLIFWVTLAASILPTMISANAATRIVAADSLSGIVSAPVLLSLTLLGLMPLGVKRLMALAGKRA